jgi:hypothetical protein
MKKLLPTLLVATGFIFTQLPAQISIFSNQTALLPTTTYSSGNSIGVVDMNGDFKDDIVRTDNTSMSVCYQTTPNGNFTETNYNYSDPQGNTSLSSPWGMCVGDVNNDGVNDVLWGENGTTRMMYWNGSGYTCENVTTTTSSGYIFVQGANYFDINNDGYLDAFVCNDVAMSHIYLGSATGWTMDQSVMPLSQSPVLMDPDSNSGNYASIWTDINNDGLIDLMITHCRQGVSQSTDPRRIDQIWMNNGNGTYTQDVTNWTGLRDGAQGWSTAFGDIDNDGDMDAFVLNQDVNGKMLINNGAGVFTDVMSGSGITNTTAYFGENATFHDFDNDGYLDLLISGGDCQLYKGNGDGTFTQVSAPFPYSSNKIRAHCVGDLNGDGFLDVYGSYCSLYNSPSGSRRDRLWMNTSMTTGNHWIKFNLVGGAIPGMSNKNGIGAIVKIYGPWGVQIRDVRSGEAYGIQNSLTMHFGLGQNTAIDSVVIVWPSGIVDKTLGLSADVAYTIPENSSPTSTNSRDLNPFLLSVYPSPMSDNATIRLDHFANYGLNNLSLNIYNAQGQLVYTEASIQNSIIPISRQQLGSGLFFVEIMNKEQRLATERLLVR